MPNFWHTSWRPYAGVISDGFGSGSSPAPYIVDPLSGFVAAGKKQERPVAVDGFFSDDPTFGTVVGETGPIVPLDNMLETADAALVFVAAVAMEGYDRTTLEVSARRFSREGAGADSNASAASQQRQRPY